MSFESALRTTRLPEKPWSLGAIARLAVGVATCMVLLGGTTALVIRFFEAPQKASTLLFLACVACAVTGAAVALFMLLRPWRNEERLLFNLIVLLSGIYGGLMFSWLAGRVLGGEIASSNSIETMFIAVIFFQGAALVLVHFFLKEHQTGWREGFGLNLQPGRAVLIGVCGGILATGPVLWLNGVSFHLFEKLSLHPQEQSAVQALRHTTNLLAYVASGITTVLVAPFGEEVLFRGILYPYLKRRFSPAIGLWSTAIVFGAIHFNLSSFLPLVVLALLLVLLYEYTGNLLAPIAVHCVFNGANFAMLYWQQQN